MFRILLVSVFGLIVSAAGDDQCTPWDDMIEDLVINPATDQIKEATGGFIPIPDYRGHYKLGTHLTALGGVLGNLTTIKLYKTAKKSGVSATDRTAFMCQDSSNITIGLHVGLADLEATFKDFTFKVPVLPAIGDTKTTIKNTGNGVSLSLSLISNGTSCKASLNYLNVLDYGTTTFHFENGKINKIYQKLLSHGIGPLIKVLRTFGILKKVEHYMEVMAAQLITQEGQKICDILSIIS